jgi:hypothetical protein
MHIARAGFYLGPTGMLAVLSTSLWRSAVSKQHLALNIYQSDEIWEMDQN